MKKNEEQGRLRKSAINQPAPTPGNVNVGELVLADIQARIDLGKSKYRTLTQTQNGRDVLMDAYQESIELTMYLALIQTQNERDALMDAYPEPFELAMYLKQAILERDAQLTETEL